ncbi:hypothetical protein M514_01671 [Trichuris suis]|uniref:Uncharacterized protein n=1 Tax=Trichuris suis TaxID=68888 RepID=A0A085MK22_9BILA|nr:hypothetical protein M513_01671 [Trichuris suis]KFD64857.1 hypothetical protein M514_01671 [Trichuris suis]KHJ49227.1 hypothetical protein D918_00348 [Trichuris suis]
MYYCSLCFYESADETSVLIHLQTIHRLGGTKSWRYITETERPVAPRIGESISSPAAPYSAISAEHEALQRILKAAEDVMRSRQNPVQWAGKYRSSICISCFAYHCEVSSMEKIVKEMELIENLKTIRPDGNTPLPCCIATPQQLSALEKLRNSCLQLLITLGFVSLGTEQ